MKRRKRCADGQWPSLVGPIEVAAETITDIAFLCVDGDVDPAVAIWSACIEWPPLATYPDLRAAVDAAIACERERVAAEVAS